RACSAQDHRARYRPHIPNAASLPEHDGQGERHGGGVRPHEGRGGPIDAAHAWRAARGKGNPSRRGGEAVVLRRQADGLPLGSACLQPLLRESETTRDRARHGDTGAHPAARRAGRRHEPAGNARDHRADRNAPRRRRLHDPRDRTRYARRRRYLGPGRRPRSRRQDRRRLVRGSCDRPAGRRGIPRPANGGNEMSTNGASDLLRLTNIDTYYGEIHILESLDLNVREGELVSLLGGNASGKSTTLKTILGVVQPRNGAVEFRGEEV